MLMTMQEAEQYGFHFGPGFREWITAENTPRLAQDAALNTAANSLVPAEFGAYIDPAVVEILTRPLKAREVLPEVKKGDWTIPYAKFRISEVTGGTAPYSDSAANGPSGVNNVWVNRENYLFQTVIQYGDLETAVTATARINLAADKQRAAARVLDVDANRFYLLGVAGKEIYGLLNEPSLNAPVAPAASGQGSGLAWDSKNTKQRYEDVLLLFRELVRQTGGYVDKDSSLILCLSPELAVNLAAATDFNVSVQDMLEKYFRHLKIVTIPELSNPNTGETMLLLAEEVRGQKTGELAFTEKFRAGRLVPELSGFSQKWTAGTCGAVIYLPLAIAQMRGM